MPRIAACTGTCMQPVSLANEIGHRNDEGFRSDDFGEAHGQYVTCVVTLG